MAMNIFVIKQAAVWNYFTMSIPRLRL